MLRPGMALGMQQGALPVGSVAQTLPIAGMPQTISMVSIECQESYHLLYLSPVYVVTVIAIHTRYLSVVTVFYFLNDTAP